LPDCLGSSSSTLISSGINSRIRVEPLVFSQDLGEVSESQQESNVSRGLFMDRLQHKEDVPFCWVVFIFLSWKDTGILPSAFSACIDDHVIFVIYSIDITYDLNWFSFLFGGARDWTQGVELLGRSSTTRALPPEFLKE
jgi:hypothetical protein